MEQHGFDSSGIGAVVYEATIAELQAAMTGGQVTGREIVAAYLERIEQIDRAGPGLRSVIEVNPEALAIAAALDEERMASGPRGPLHGIPIMLKDNIDTADQMLTTAGSLALASTRPAEDATVARRLRAAGAVILGKANMSEWANFRSNRSTSGWSGRGGQTRNPYVLDRNPCGSSSGSAVAVAASLCAAAIGTETDGSIVCPSAVCGVVGIKPTVGLTSRAGVVPLGASQDTVGPHGRTVADAALVLGAIAGADPRDPATAAGAEKAYADYTAFLDLDGLRGARIGVPRSGLFGYHLATDQVAERAIRMMRELGAEIVDPVEMPSMGLLASDELEVLLYEFKDNLNRYLASRVPVAGARGPVMRTLADIIAFNEAHAAEELPFFGQELLLRAEAKGPLTEGPYLEAWARNRRASREAIDTALSRQRLDALVAPTATPAWPTDPVLGDRHMGGSSATAAVAGYPLVTVPAGEVHGLPVAITFMGGAYSEAVLIRLAYAFEQATKARRPPRFLPTLL